MDQFYITNPKAGEYSAIDDPRARYIGLMFIFNKRFSNNWMVNASYTYSQLKGNEQGGRSKSSTWRDPNRQVNTYGNLGNDPTHALKIYSTLIIPKVDVLLSPTFQYVTGAPWTRRTRTSVSGRPTVNIEPLGSQRYSPTINFDIRLEKFFRFGGDRIEFQVDIFNVFNRGIATSVESRVERTSFNLATWVNPGRRFRVGVRFLF